MPKFVHIVLWKLADSPTASTSIQKILDLAAPGRLEAVMGPSIVPPGRSEYDWGLYSVFVDEEAYKTYADSEEHVECALKHVRPNATKSMAFDWVMPA